MNLAPITERSKEEVLAVTPRTIPAPSAIPVLHNISSDPRIKEYLLGAMSTLCRGNVLLQLGQFGDMDCVYPDDAAVK
jgi:hypothetical protein